MQEEFLLRACGAAKLWVPQTTLWNGVKRNQLLLSISLWGKSSRCEKMLSSCALKIYQSTSGSSPKPLQIFAAISGYCPEMRGTGRVESISCTPVSSIFCGWVLEAEPQPRVVGRKQSSLWGAAYAKKWFFLLRFGWGCSSWRAVLPTRRILSYYSKLNSW